MALTPSYDFSLFDLPSFNPLTAEEFGVSTSFNAADPTQWVDNSLNTLSSYLQPFNPLPYLSNQFPYISPDLITPQAPQTFFQTPMGTPSRSVLLGGGQTAGTAPTTVNVNVGQGQGNAPAGYTPQTVCVDANGNQVPVGTPGASCGTMNIGKQQGPNLSGLFPKGGLADWLGITKFFEDIRKQIIKWLIIAAVLLIIIVLLTRR
jgi:hypothetical protein